MRAGRLALLLACLLMAGTGCGSDPSNDAVDVTPASPSSSAGLALTSLGDSTASGSGDEAGAGGWVARYAALLEEATGKEVEVSARAQNGQLTADLLLRLKGDERLRSAVGEADVVVLGTGGADLNSGDDAWAAGSCSGPACYTTITATYARDIDAVAAEIVALRAGEPTLLRAITPPNNLTGAEGSIPDFLRTRSTEIGVLLATANRTATCAAMRAHGGECVDVLTAFNGPDGTKGAYETGLLNLQDCCYPSAKGHQLMAELLAKTGTALTPLR